MKWALTTAVRSVLSNRVNVDSYSTLDNTHSLTIKCSIDDELVAIENLEYSDIYCTRREELAQCRFEKRCLNRENMSAAIQQRTERSWGQSSAALWPAYRQDSNPRLLGRAQHRDDSPLYANSTFGQFSQYTDKKRSNLQEGSLHRVSTPFLESRMYAPPGADNEDGNIKQNEVGSKQVCARPEESPVNNPLNEAVHLATGSYQQVYDSGYLNSGNLKEAAAQRAFYYTSTQRLYSGVDWPERIVPSPAPPQTTKEMHPDMVSFRFKSKRYEPHSERWQKFGSRPFSWDYVQKRDGHHIRGPVQFCSPGKKIVHIPGYMGHVSGGPGEMDNPSSYFVSANRMRTLQPKYSETARKGNIPGYTGCVLYSEYQPACINDSEHLRSTAAISYRQHDEIQCNSKSPFKKSSSMSRMVTLTHPFNPFNKVY